MVNRVSGDLLEPLDIPAAHAAVAQRLRRSIALGVVLPGERLPSERTLAERLGVSRVTVREALRVLQGEGLIVTRRGGNGGAVVTPCERSPLRGQLDEVFEFRLAVETMAARLAAERRGEEALDRLRACQQALLASGDVGTFRRADSAFHLAVAGASGNPMLRRAIEDARAIAFDVLDAHPFRVRRESSARGHAAIVAAIGERDDEGAAAAMSAHLRLAHSEVRAALAEALAPSADLG